MARRRAGYGAGQVPTAVSGAGAASRRTDQTPAGSQPVRETPSARYGQRAENAALQGAAPMASRDETRFGSGRPVAANRGTPPPIGDVFAPTERPGESAMMGAQTQPPVGGDYFPDAGPDLLLRALYAAYPDPAILRLARDIG